MFGVEQHPVVALDGDVVVVLDLPQGVELGRETIFGPSPPGWTVMQSIKNRFDPKGILNRDRFLVGHDSIVPGTLKTCLTAITK